MSFRLPTAALLACAAAPVCAADMPGKTSFTVSAGTLGIGLEIAHTLPVVNLTGRLAWNGFSYDYSDTVDGIRYEAELDLNNVTALVDWRPWGKFTHFTAGLVYNNNAIAFSGAPAASYTIGSMSFAADQVGRLSGDVTFDKLVPYAGLGWNIPVAPRTALSLELGVVFQGEPQLSLQADGVLAADPIFQSELEREQADAQRDLSQFEYYPVVSLGLQRRF